MQCSVPKIDYQAVFLRSCHCTVLTVLLAEFPASLIPIWDCRKASSAWNATHLGFSSLATSHAWRELPNSFGANLGVCMKPNPECQFGRGDLFL
ncbi:unnamed protein product [Ixodes persulcatus]